MIYSGIGSRTTPYSICQYMFSVAKYFNGQNYLLRSGGAKGADTWFSLGSSKKEIYRPKDATQEALNMVAKIHPNWSACNHYVKLLHARNCQIILGRQLNMPSDFVVCYSKNGAEVGGTRTGIVLAKQHNIPVYNLGTTDGIKAVEKLTGVEYVEIKQNIILDYVF